MKYRPEIDGLRALAIIPVVLFHAGFSGFSGGYLGVDVFFVISGYLITSIILSDIEKGEFSYKKFYERRARRILPALFLVVIVCIPFAWMLFLPPNFVDFSQSVVAVSLFIPNILFWVESGYFDTSAALKPLLHTWSLGLEEQFYILYPIALLAVFRYSKKHLGIFMLIGIILSLLLAEYLSRYYPSANFYLLPSRGWELLVGAYIAYRENNKSAQVNEILSAQLSTGGVLLIIGSVVFFNEQTRHPSVISMVPVIGTALVIAFGRTKSLTNFLLSHRLLVGIGLISYSLYLWHQPVFVFARTISLVPLNQEKYIALILASVVLALLSYKYVEAPFRSRQRVRANNVWILSALVTSSLIIFGLVGHITNGLPGRIPHETLRILYTDGVNSLFVMTQDERQCHARSLRDACILGKNNASPSWVLVGDSHAGALAASINHALSDIGESGIQVTSDGCPYALGLERKDLKNQGCLERNNLIRNRLLQQDIKNVIISARYVLYLEKTRFDNNEGGIEAGNDVWLGPVEDLTEEERYRRVLQSYRETIEELLDHDKTVYLIYPIPEVGFDVTLQFIKEKSEGTDRVITTSAAVYNSRSRSVISAFDKIGLHTNLNRIYPGRIFCNSIVKERCVAEIDNKILYFDDDHLNIHGADIVIQKIFKKTKTY
jgi:peptidoglycan/LPS O-acetylase OafA/YrhL